MKFRGKKKNFGGGGWTDFNLKMPNKSKMFFHVFQKVCQIE